MSSKDYHRLIVQTRAPWRPGSGSATPGAHGCGGAATARVLALICPPALGGLDGQLWCPACLQVTLRCSKTSLSSLTSGILERVPFFFFPNPEIPSVDVSSLQVLFDLKEETVQQTTHAAQETSSKKGLW